MASDDSSTELSHDLIYQLLSNSRRRTIIYLLKQKGAMRLQELSEEVASFEFDSPPEELDASNRKMIYVSLYQTHIPRLEQAGLVEYNSDTGLVEATDTLLNLNFQMKVSRGHSTTVYRILQGVIALSTLFLLISTVIPILGFSVGTTTLAIVMPLLSIILGLIYYIEQIKKPDIEGISIEKEEDDG